MTGFASQRSGETASSIGSPRGEVTIGPDTPAEAAGAPAQGMVQRLPVGGDAAADDAGIPSGVVEPGRPPPRSGDGGAGLAGTASGIVGRRRGWELAAGAGRRGPAGAGQWSRGSGTEWPRAKAAGRQRVSSGILAGRPSLQRPGGAEAGSETASSGILAQGPALQRPGGAEAEDTIVAGDTVSWQRPGAAADASSSGGALRRKPTPVGLLDGLATTSMTRDVLQSMIVEHGLEMFGESIDKLVFWWADAAVTGIGRHVIQTIMATGLGSGIQQLARSINPILGAFQAVRGIVAKLPTAIKTIVAYSVGRGLVSLLGNFIATARAEALVNQVFIGGDLTTSIATAYAHLDDIVHRPGTLLYNLVWQRWLGPRLATSAPSFGAYAAERVGERYLGQTEGQSASHHELGPAEREAVAGARHTGAPSPSASEPDGPPPASEHTGAPDTSLVKANLKYLWLEVDAPELARFSHQDRPSGGLQLPFNLGLNLFGVKLGSQVMQHIQLPWSGGFNVALQNIQLTNVPSLPPVFQVGALELAHLTVSDQGLQSFEVAIHDLAFANNLVKLPEVRASWTQGAGLTFTGAMALQVFGTSIQGTGKLALDELGTFAGAELGIHADTSIEIIPKLLTLQNPAFQGSVSKAGQIALQLSASASSDLSGILPGSRLTMTRAFVAYDQGRFRGGIDAFELAIGEHVRLSAANAAVDGDRITVDEAALLYEHDPEHPDAAKHDLTTIGGIDPRLLSFTGLKSLTIGGRLFGLRIGARRVDASAASLAVPDGQLAAPVTTPLVDRDAFGIDSAEPVLSKIGATLFGVSATLDVANRRGEIAGKQEFSPKIPELDLSYPLVPGLSTFVALGADLKLAADIGATATMPQPDRFALEGSAGVRAAIGMEIKAGERLGSGWIASLSADVFGRAEASVDASSTLRGVVVIDRAARRLRPSQVEGERPTITYHAGAELSASVGLEVFTSGLVFVNKHELWHYTIKKWTLGHYNVEGVIRSGGDGAPELEPPDAGFHGGQPLHPEIHHVQIENPELELVKPQLIRNSGPARRAYLEKLHREHDEPAARRLDAAMQAYADLRAEAAAHASGPDAAVWDQRIATASARLDAAHHVYRLIQLELVEMRSLPDEQLELGLDIAELEDQLRRAAAHEDHPEEPSSEPGAADGDHVEEPSSAPGAVG